MSRLVSPESVDFMMALQISKGRGPDEDLRAEVTQTLLRRALLAREASQAQLDREPKVRSELAVARAHILAQSWESQLRRQFAPTAPEVMRRYEELKAEHRKSGAREPFPTFDAVSGNIAASMAGQSIDRHVATLAQRAGVTRALGSKER